MTEPEKRNLDGEKVAELTRDIFALFAKVDPPLGIAAQATTIVLVQLALKADVTRIDLVRSIEKIWRATTARGGKRN